MMALSTYISYQRQDAIAYSLADDIAEDIKILYGIDDTTRVAIIGKLVNNPRYGVVSPIASKGLLYEGEVIDQETGYWSTIRTWNSFYSNKFGIINKYVVSYEEYCKITDSLDFKEMEIYPSSKSIRKINDIIVVKISDIN